jgi:hypothetical protein
MTTRVLITMSAAFALLTTAAHAGVNTCEGTVTVGPQWTTVVGETGNYAPNGCRFPTASKLGRRIIAACSNGSQCIIDVSLKELSDASLNETVLREVCHPNSRCLARDNPEFFKDDDPAFYKRLTSKPVRTIKVITNVEQSK